MVAGDVQDRAWCLSAPGAAARSQLLASGRENAMNVAAILNHKGRAVTTAGPDTVLMEIANKLAAKRIGAIVIVGARGEVAGIVSERDIIRALAEQGAACLKQPV